MEKVVHSIIPAWFPLSPINTSDWFYPWFKSVNNFLRYPGRSITNKITDRHADSLTVLLHYCYKFVGIGKYVRTGNSVTHIVIHPNAKRW